MRDERCSECGGEIITVARSAEPFFPERRRCRAFFSHGAPSVRPRAICEALHPTLVGLACSEDRGHDTAGTAHWSILVVVGREEHEVVW